MLLLFVLFSMQFGLFPSSRRLGRSSLDSRELIEASNDYPLSIDVVVVSRRKSDGTLAFTLLDDPKENELFSNNENERNSVGW